MPTLDRRVLLDHLDTYLDANAVVDLAFDLNVDRGNLCPEGMLKRRCLINLIEYFEQRDKYADLLTTVADFLTRHGLPLPSGLPSPPRRGDGGEVSVFPIRHNLPRRNQNFTGRADLLAALEKTLAAGRPVAVQALHGLGGIGKTSLALEYAHRHLDDYDLVAWLRAEDAVTLASDLADLAAPLGLPQASEADQTVVVKAVLRWLEGHGRWLLVYDNAPDPGAVKPYLPRTGGHVLLTSRHRDWAELGPGLDVPLLPLPDAVALLQTRSGRTDATDADRLAEALGRLPLALMQAAAYIANTGLNFTAYLDLLTTRRADLWQDEQAPWDHPQTVAVTLSLALDRARQTPGASELLTLCAFFAPDDIPLSVLVAGRDHLPDPLPTILADSLALNRLVSALIGLSLLIRTDDSLSVHRLVQAVTLDHLPPDQAHAWATTALTLLQAAYPQGNLSIDIDSWPRCARLLPHALVVTAYTARHTLAPSATVRLLNQLTEYLRLRGQFSDARVTADRAVHLSEAALDPDDSDVAQSLNYLGRILQEQGDYPTARTYYERALAIREKTLGPDHCDTASSLNDLAVLLHDQGDLPVARDLHERALAIREKVLGPDHPDTAVSLDNLATVVHDQGDLPVARDLYGRALAVREKVLGPDHPDTAVSLDNLATVVHDQGDLPAARALHERALAIRGRVLGPDHPHTASSLANLAAVLHNQGDLPTARAHYERALTIDEKVYGPDHPEVATDLNNLAAVLHDERDLPGARTLHELALTIREKTLGPYHPDTASSLANLATVLGDQGDFRAARPLLERALRIKEKALGPDHPDVATTLHNLSVALRRLGQQRAADKAHNRAVAIRKKHSTKKGSSQANRRPSRR